MAQADQYLKDTGNDLEGLQWKVRVLRAKGAFGEELKFYQGLEGRNANSWFQAEGIGQLYQKLGLLVPAEANLRRAVELAPTDSRPRATLAILLHEQHRDREALEQSQRSFAGINAVTAPADKVRIATALISCQLTDGDVAGARSTVASAGEAATPYLRGCVDYAAGELQTALDQFRVAAAGADGNVALLGVAASLLGLKQWQEAQAAFETVADQAPLLRHRAFSGMALLDLRLGQRDRAMSHLDRALEANPLDSYCHYLRGRVLREQGQIGPALDEQTTVLHHHDDFVHAIAEVALLHGQLAREAGGEQQAEHFVAAVRYIDRAVDLARPPLQELCEQQGLLHFDSADLRGAAAAFTAARDLATDDPGRLFARSALALCDYAQGGADEARTQLQRMGGDLPKDAPIRTWAEATVERIDDHSQKEQLDDHFERTDLGKVWLVEGAGNLAPSIVDGELAFNGPFGKIGAITVGRDGAVKKASNFLAVECRMQLKPGHQRNDSFAGVMLELQKAQGSGQSDFRVKLGIRDGQAWYRLEDGRSEPLQIICKPNGFDAAAWQTLQIRIVPLGDRNQNQFGLVLLWNGQPLLSEPRRLDSLRPNMAAELRTMLTVESGKKDSQVDVRFDDYHLERRKENP
jgi:tetratricopeptide (TPR) repeat protein